MIEVLVAIGITGLLISLLLPAIQGSREAARRVQCLNHLRQIGQACAERESAHRMFPASLMGSGASRTAPPSQRLSPHVALLPFLDQAALFENIDQSEDGLGAADDPPTSSKNPAAIKTRLTVFACPSDHVATGGNSYRVCIGTTPQMHTTIPQDDPNAARIGALGGQGSGVPAEKISDGLSQTIFFSEKLVGDRNLRTYTPWRDYFLSGGVFKYPSDAATGCQLPMGVDPVHVSFGGSTWLLAGYDFTWYNHIAVPNAALPDCSAGRLASGATGGSFAARSAHPGGVNVVFGDSAAKFMNSQIDLTLWRALGTRSGKEIVSAASF